MCTSSQPNTSHDFQNSQNTINLSTLISYTDSILLQSSWEIECMFLLMCYYTSLYWIIPDVSLPLELSVLTYLSVETCQLLYVFIKSSNVVISIYRKVIGKYFSINGDVV